MAVSTKTLRKLALALPGVEEGTSYGTPAYRVRKKLIARLWEDDETLVLATTWDERAELCEAAPEVFYFTDHYENYEYVLVRLPEVARKTLEALLESAWRRHASKKQLAERAGG